MLFMPDPDHTALSKLVPFKEYWPVRSPALLPPEIHTLHVTEIHWLAASTHYVRN